MTTRECFLWLRKRREQLGAVDRPHIRCDALFAHERRLRQEIGRHLFHDRGFAWISGDPQGRVAAYLTQCRLAYAESLIVALMLPYSPCRVRNWNREQHLHWLMIVSWDVHGVKEWQEVERLRGVQMRDSFSE